MAWTKAAILKLRGLRTGLDVRNCLAPSEKEDAKHTMLSFQETNTRE
jgi:hypothetical protein